MFFTDDVLVSRGGKFAIIWMAATRKQRLKRKDYDGVDVPKICRELQKHFRPTFDGRMTTIRGFSLRLSAQLVYGVSVVYNMKVVNLYKETSLSVQSLHRFQSQLQLYPVEPTTVHPVPPAVQQALPETFRNEDPMFGLPPEDVDVYISNTSTSTVPSDEVLHTTSKQAEGAAFLATRDLSMITLTEDLPQAPISFFEGQQNLLEGDEALGTDMINDMLNLDNAYTAFLDTEAPVTSGERSQAIQNITTPAAGILTGVTAPTRPIKTRPTATSPASKASSDTLAVPLRISPSKTSTDRDDPTAVEDNALLEAVLPGLDQSSSDNASRATSDLILLPLEDQSSTKKHGARARSSLLVDNKTELHSDVIRSQLMASLNSIGEYIREGNMDVLPSTLPSAKELFDCPAVTSYRIAPTRQDVYKGQSAQIHQKLDKIEDLPQTLFNDIVNALPTNLSRQKRPARFSAHHAVYEETELLRPEEENEMLKDVGATFEPNVTEISAAAAGDDTIMTEGSSLQTLRNLSRTTGMTVGPGIDPVDDISGLSMHLDESQFRQDFHASLTQAGLDIPELPEQQLDVSNVLPSCSTTWSVGEK